MLELAKRNCVPCAGGVPPMAEDHAKALLAELDHEWTLADRSPGLAVLQKTYRFKDFAEGLEFVNRVGALAEEQGHHPDLHLAWGQVIVEVWTHKIKGLTESDFVFAAKCEALG